MADFDSLDQLERAKTSLNRLPEELSFTRLVKNKTDPPYSLRNFPDYLYYVEHEAESLQFFLWYCAYIERWSRLPPKERARSRVWDPDEAGEPTSRSHFVTYSSRAAIRDKINKILTIMELEFTQDVDETAAGKEEEAGDSHSRARSEGKPTFQRPDDAFSSSGPDPHRSTHQGQQQQQHQRVQSAAVIPARFSGLTRFDPPPQPLRAELDRAADLYLAAGGARALRHLSASDRAACRHAALHTTHPSALLPAFLHADARLRGTSHPAFVRWSRANADRARLALERAAGLALFAFGCGVCALLVFRVPLAPARAACAALWWPALAALSASLRGLSLALYFAGVRQLHPWEEEEEENEGGRKEEWDWAGSAKGADQPWAWDGEEAPAGKPYEMDINGRDSPLVTEVAPGSDTSSNSIWSSKAVVDDSPSANQSSSSARRPRPRPRLTVIVPTPAPGVAKGRCTLANLYSEISSEHSRRRRRRQQRQPTQRSFWARAFGPTAPATNQAIRRLQTQAVLFSCLASAVVTAVLTAGSLCIPVPTR